MDNSLAALAEAGLADHPAPAVGMMIELPSVVELMPAFTRIAGFCSIGTNDFIQYMLAADRSNDRNGQGRRDPRMFRFYWMLGCGN